MNCSILLQRHVEILYQRRINSINRLLLCTLNPLWNLNPPEGQVNPPSGNSIKTVKQVHKRQVILIEIACLFFMCYDTPQCEAEDLSALPDDYWQAIRIYGDETSYEKEYT